MYRIDNDSAAVALPAPGAAGTPGYFTAGDPVGGVEATIVDADWLNAVQEELGGIVEATGATLSKTVRNQLLTAIVSMSLGLAGSSTNLASSLATAGKSVTFTGSEVVVKSALGGLGSIIPNLNLTINTATTGAGGMDTGTPAVNGYVGVYLIKNPTTGDKKLLATNEGASALSPIYSGANPIAGYTQSGLISVLATDGSGNFKTFTQKNRRINITPVSIVSISVASAVALTGVNIAAVVPKTAIAARGYASTSNSIANNYQTISISGIAANIGPNQVGSSASSTSGGTTGTWGDVDLVVTQTIYWAGAITGGTATYAASVGGYTI